MPRDLFQYATWPGVSAVASCQYICGHGISPGRAVLVTYPQFAEPQEYGNLTFSDGIRSATVRGCKVDSISPQWTTSGVIYTLDILDERWQWQGFGSISGHYNQKDDHGKLIPWTIRSPSELAGLCFAALGIQRGTVILPPGLSRAAGGNLDRYLRLGENFPQILTNPEMVWDHTPPAEALSQLADTYGCRVIYRPFSSRVDVVPLGKGVPFPNLPFESVGATISSVPSPAAVGVYGPPVDIQARFLLEPVGEEWHGGRLPIDQLSYAPVSADKPQVARVKETGASGAAALGVRVEYKDLGGAPQTAVAISSGGGTNTAKFASIATKLNGVASLAAVVAIVPDATGINFTGKVAGAFSLSCFDPSTAGLSSWATSIITAAGGQAKVSWGQSQPPLFRNVQATDRLSYSQAQALASRTVFREYRILNRDPHDFFNLDKPGRPLTLPWAGRVARRQQILLLDKKVEEVIPQPRIPGAVNKNAGVGAQALNIPGQGVLPEFYNGYSRAQKAVVYGSVATRIGNANWMLAMNPDPNKNQLNTEVEDRVFVDFSINQVEQLVVFSEPVYRWLGGVGGALVEPAFLTLECAVNVMNPETNAPLRWEEILRIPGGTAPVEWKYREDLEVGVIGRYGLQNKLLGFGFAYLADAKSRAGYYLRAQAARFQITGGESRQYIGIVPHDPDGYCQQVVMTVGESGPTTVVSGNTEWHPTAVPYPARRKMENAPPDKTAAAANVKERELLRQITPFEVKKES